MVELLIVVLVIAVAMSIAIPSINNWLQEYRLGIASQVIADNLQLAKMRAVAKTRKIALLFDVEGNRLGLEGATLVSLPTGVVFGKGTAITLPDPQIPSEDPVTFAPLEGDPFLRAATFTGRGLPNSHPGDVEAVFLTNAVGTRCVTMTSAGNIRTWTWDGSMWK